MTSGQEPGVAARYRADSGAEEYWAFQEPIGRETARFDLWKIGPHVSPSDRLVEFGCGGAFLLEVLEAAEKIGVEANPLARESGIKRGLDIRPALDAIPEGWADVLWSHHALEHTLHPYTVLEGMHRVLRPGGRLVLWLPIDDWRAQRRATEPDVNGHLWTWTPLLAQNLMQEVGFSSVDARVVTHAWPRGARVFARNAKLWQVAGGAAAAVRRDRQLLVIAHRAAI